MRRRDVAAILNVSALAAVLGAAALAVALSGAPQPAAERGPPPLEGAFAEDFTLLDPPVPAPRDAFTDLAGQPVKLADFEGRVVLLNFWATWCAPCLREMPSLDRLQARLGKDGLAVVAVSLDRGGAPVVGPFAAKLGLRHLGLYLDSKGGLSSAFKIGGLPTSYLIDRQGRIAGALLGPAEWDAPEALALIRHYLRDDGAPERQSAAKAD